MGLRWDIIVYSRIGDALCFILQLFCLFGIYFPVMAFSQGLQAESQNTNPSLSQAYQERGLPFITNYTPEDYDGFNQNWGAVQDSLGIIYFANGDGVLMYDGVHWETIPLPNKTHVKSITIDKDNNRVYVGASREFGYLKPDKSGKMQYVSLVPYLKEKDRDFTTVWKSIATPDGIYFNTDESLFRWSENGFKVWELPDWRLFFVNDTLYTFLSGKGLMYLDEKDNIQPVPAGDQFADDAIMVLLPYKDNSLLIGTYENGFFLFKDGVKKRFTTEADDFFYNNKLYTGRKLFDGSYALGTVTGGLIVIDPYGKEQLRLDGNDILISDIVHHLYQDREGIIWASLNDGIAKIEYPSPFTIFDKTTGLNDRVQVITRYQNELLVGTATGLYFLDNDSKAALSSFKVFQDIEDKVWDLLDFDGILLVGSRDEVYQIKEGAKLLLGAWDPSAFLRSHIDRNRGFISSGDGLRSIYYQNGKWIDEGKIEGVTGAIYTIVEMESGDLWLETSEAWIWRVSFGSREKAKKLENPKIRKYDNEQGLPDDVGDIYFLDNTLYFAAANDQKTFVYNSGLNQFQPARDLRQKLKIQANHIFLNHIDQDKNIWFSTNNGDQLAKWVAWFHGDDEYLVENLKQSRITDYIGGSETLFFESKDSLLWMTGEKSVLRHNLKYQRPKSRPFHALIKTVTYQGDSLLIQGNYHSSEIEIPFKNNSFRFQYASSSFFEENTNQYQYFLEGFDEAWSAWTTETQRDFTNLSGGDYRFRVRGKNIYGEVSEEAAFAFTILPPWYRTWWAYSLYALAFMGFVIGIVKWRSRKLQREKEALQKTVAERTRQVKQQAEQLKELDEAKSRFFANISHEFRTPLTLILGQVQQLESDGLSDNPQPVYQMIKRNGKRVLGLVNQLLDLSTLESGKMKLQTQKTELVSFLKPIVAAYDSLAESKGITFSFKSTEDNIPVYLDTDKMEKVVQNVVSNAFKFTDVGGEITVTVAAREMDAKPYAQIQVEDNGKGIAADQLDKIFDRFYQADDSNAKRGEGSGIGLALAKELVTLHKGTISVESSVGKGSCFTILVPLGKEHLSSDEIVDQPVNKGKETNEDHGPQHEAIADESLAEESVSSRDTPQLLIVEDNADMRRYIGQILHPHYQIAEAADGSEGWEKAIEMIPDLIISDVMMPETDGFELCSRLKSDERTSHIPVILLTAKAGKTSKLEGLETRADDYLTKPFDADELLLLLRNRIEQRKRLRERFSKEVTLQPKDISITSADERFLQKATDIVEEHIDDFDFNVQEFVEQMHLGHTQVNRKLKALTDLTPVQFIRFMRLKRAAQKIARQEDTISQIAYSVGFNNLSYFAKCFKEQFGQSPSDYAGE